MGKTGVIVAWTIIRVPPGEFTNQAPYLVAIVALDSGERITAQLVDWEQKHVQAGQRVVTVVRRTVISTCDSVIPYGIKVKPL